MRRMMSKELWKDIKGYEGKYLISNFGRVKSIIKKTTLLIPYKSSYNKRIPYFKVVLQYNPKKYYYVHRLVALHFIPNPENKPQVNHIDGNSLNNHYTNLEWCTQKENNQHAFRIGLQQLGENRPNAKLLNKDIKTIKKLYRPKTFPYHKIAEIYNVSYVTIWKVVNNKSYLNKYI
jgi:uncharacterized protein (UPF0248 family)